MCFCNCMKLLFLHHQVSVLYTGMQSQKHTYNICTFLVKEKMHAYAFSVFTKPYEIGLIGMLSASLH